MRFLYAIPLLLLVACDSGEPEPARLVGTFNGNGNVSGVVLQHRFVIQENENGFVDGQVTITFVDNGDTFEFDVDGTHADGTFDLDIAGTSDGLDYRGTTNEAATTMTGVMQWPTGSGLPDYALTVSRSGSSVQTAPVPGSASVLASRIRSAAAE